MNKIKSGYYKAMAFSAVLLCPVLAKAQAATPADQAADVIDTASDVFALAAAVGISVLAYRIVKGLVSRFSK